MSLLFSSSYLVFMYHNLWTSTNASLRVVVDDSEVAVGMVVPKAQGPRTDQRQHHLQAPLLKAAHHPPALHQEFPQYPTRPHLLKPCL